MNTSTKAIPLIPAITGVSGKYAVRTEEGVLWRYDYQIEAAGTKSESRSGQLSVENADLPAAEPGDRVRTPWGTMQLASDSHDCGWLLELSQCRPIDLGVGKLLEVPAAALERGGAWRGAAGAWDYSIRTNAMGSRSERRAGELRHRGLVILGETQGDYAETPWGPVCWMGPVNEEATTDYEQGFLLRGTFDRSLDDQQRELLALERATVEFRLESLYLEPAVKLAEGRGGHGIRLRFVRRPAADAMPGTLLFDPNTCSLNAFGDRTMCTKMGSFPIPVTVTRQRLADPSGLGRWFLAVRGEGLPAQLALIMDPSLERFVLKSERALVPLFPDRDGW